MSITRLVKNKLGICLCRGCKKRVYATLRIRQGGYTMGYCKKHYKELTKELLLLKKLESEK